MTAKCRYLNNYLDKGTAFCLIVASIKQLFIPPDISHVNSFSKYIYTSKTYQPYRYSINSAKESSNFSDKTNLLQTTALTCWVLVNISLFQLGQTLQIHFTVIVKVFPVIATNCGFKVNVWEVGCLNGIN